MPDEIEEEDDGWSLYIVSMLEPNTMEPLDEGWPIMAETFDNAMTTYELLLRLQLFNIVEKPS